MAHSNAAPRPHDPVAPPGSRLPTVLAGASFAPAGGDAYFARDLAFDEAGRALVLCDYAGDSTNAAHGHTPARSGHPPPLRLARLDSIRPGLERLSGCGQ